MKINCLAIDDEPLALNLIENFAKKIPFLNLINTCDSVCEAMEKLKTEKVELLFLDVNMPDISGTQFIKSIHNPPMVIFTTAYEKYAVESFELNAVDYLLKPFSFERFFKAVDKAYSLNTLKEQSLKQAGISHLSDEISSNTHTDNYIFVKSTHQIIKIELEDILYLESLKDYIKIYLQGEKNPVLTLHNLKSIYEILDKNKFIRVHRSYIVSIAKINSIRKSRIRIGEKEIPIGELYSEAFHKKVVEGKI